MKYEYSTKTIIQPDLETELNAFGVAGWRLVHIELDAEAEGSRYFCVFERKPAADFTFAP